MTLDGAIRPLVVRFGAMGDMVIALALIEALHRRFGAPVDVVSSGSWTKPLLERQPGVGNLHLVRSRRTPYVLSPQQWRLVDSLRRREVGPVWLCDPGEHASQLLARAGIAPEWIVDAWRDCPPLPNEHHLDRWVRFAQRSPAGLRQTGSLETAATLRDITSPPLRIQPEWREDLDAWLRTRGIADRPLVLVQAGNRRTMRWWLHRRRASNSKYWPEERWAAVIAALLRRDPRIVVVLLGVPAETRLNDDIARLVRSARVTNAALELPVQRLLALQERAVGMISVDTGPAHSAAAVGCPLVVLFGQASVGYYAPRSPGGAVQVLTGQAGGSNPMLGISVNDVEDAWERLHDTTSMTRGSV